MGVVPEATVEYLYLVVGSIFVFFEQPYISVLHIILLSEAKIRLLIKVAPEHLDKYLYLIRGSQTYFIWIIDIFPVAILKENQSQFSYGNISADDGHDLRIGKARIWSLL
jgi:hypothetical protein